jgi:hypothetical protein
VRFCLDGDFAGIGELDGIADEIDQDLGQAAAVGNAMDSRRFIRSPRRRGQAVKLAQ